MAAARSTRRWVTCRSYSDASFMHHIYGGIYWAATGNGFTAN